VNEFDMFSLHSGALKLQETFEKHGFQAETCIVSTANKHFLFPETIAAVTDAAKEFHHERDFV
jgi:hypothetical protein